MGDSPLVPKMAIDWFQNDINTIENLSFVSKITLLYNKSLLISPNFPYLNLRPVSFLPHLLTTF